MTSHLGQLTKVLRLCSRPGFVQWLGEVKRIKPSVTLQRELVTLCQTPEDKYPVCDMCLSGKKKHLFRKVATWQEKKRLNELFESCLFS